MNFLTVVMGKIRKEPLVTIGSAQVLVIRKVAILYEHVGYN
jgi:hypothetical protein